MKKIIRLCIVPVLLAAGCVSHERDFDRHFTDFSELIRARSISARWEVRSPVLSPVPPPVTQVEPVVSAPVAEVPAAPAPVDVPAAVVVEPARVAVPAPGGVELRTNNLPQRVIRAANPAPVTAQRPAGSKGSFNSSSGGAVVPSRSSSSGSRGR
ncbi:MAG: hypothetical protein NTX27_04380 [Verrucomicrobia bacterium]|nr:hypothetical protein [Verrucomicrobiota bacterium]